MYIDKIVLEEDKLTIADLFNLNLFFCWYFSCLFAVKHDFCIFAPYSMYQFFFFCYFAPYSLIPYFKFGTDWTKSRCFRNLVSSTGENHIMSIKTVLFSRNSCFYWIGSGKQLVSISVPFNCSQMLLDPYFLFFFFSQEAVEFCSLSIQVSFLLYWSSCILFCWLCC